MTVFVAVSQFSPDGVTYALHTAGDPLRYVKSVHEIVREADSRIPVTKVITQAAEIDRTIPRTHVREIVYGFRGSRSSDRLRGTLRDDVLQRRAAGRRDWNPYGPGRATRRRGLDGSAPRSTTGGGGTRDQRACRIERDPDCQIVSVRDPAQ